MSKVNTERLETLRVSLGLIDVALVVARREKQFWHEDGEPVLEAALVARSDLGKMHQRLVWEASTGRVDERWVFLCKRSLATAARVHLSLLRFVWRLDARARHKTQGTFTKFLEGYSVKRTSIEGSPKYAAVFASLVSDIDD